MAASSLITLSSAATSPLEEVGGKAAALGRLISMHAPVPPGFVVPPTLDLGSAKSAILDAFDALGAKFVAVRSSATGEDAADKSWAGQFESYLYVSRASLMNRLADCRASGASSRAKSYDITQSNMSVAVLVQAMVPAEIAGVLFSVNPITHDPSELMIEAVYGLGEQLVQGLATPDNYLVEKSTAHLKNQLIIAKPTKLVGRSDGITEEAVQRRLQNKAALSSAQLAELAHLAVKLEVRFGYPLDIEWAYAQDQLYIVQARPITTL